MHESTSTTGCRRSRARRALCVCAGMAALATPMAMAPAASAQALPLLPSLPALPALPTLGDFTGNIGEGVTGGTTLADPVGSGSSKQDTCYRPDGIGSAGSCVVVPAKNAVDPGRRVKARVKARRVGGALRWVVR